MHGFIQLIHIALGRKETLDAPLSDGDWDKMYAFAKKHALLGIVYKAIMSLPSEQLPPRRVKIQFALAAEKIASRNKVMDEYSASATAMMKELGMQACVLKGQAVARRYPWPDARQSGDIDLWVDKDIDAVLPLLRSRWELNEVFYHHAGIRPFPDTKTEVEVHFMPSWMYNPFTNRKLQEYFRGNSQKQFDNFLSDMGFSSATCGFDCVFSLVHIFRHLFLEGIGLRQIIDYHFILQDSSSEERRDAYVMACGIGMERFVPALMYVLKYVTGLEDEKLLCSPDERSGEFLLHEILRSGNFGRYDSRNVPIRLNGKKELLSVRFFRRLKRLFTFFGIAPGEVLWAPFFKVWQQIWRMVHRY